MKNYVNLPNFITALRAVGTIAVIFIEPFTLLFYIVYSFCGLTDALDGLAARAMRLESRLGAKLDSAADIFFYTVMLFKMLPTLSERLPVWIWVVTWAAVGIRAASYLTAAVRYRKFTSQHTYLNKLSGFTLFVVPYFPPTPVFLAVCAVTSLVCFLSSVEEFIMHLTEKEYDSSKKTILRPGADRKDSA